MKKLKARISSDIRYQNRLLLNLVYYLNSCHDLLKKCKRKTGLYIVFNPKYTPATHTFKNGGGGGGGGGGRRAQPQVGLCHALPILG